MQATFGPALALAPEGPPTHHGLLINNGIPEHTHPLTSQQQAEAEIQVVGDGVFIEATAIQQHLTANQLSIAPQFTNSPLGNTSQLHFRIEGHLQGLGPGQPVGVGPNHGFTQLHSP